MKQIEAARARAAAGERLGVLCAMAGSVLMMALDLALG